MRKGNTGMHDEKEKKMRLHRKKKTSASKGRLRSPRFAILITVNICYSGKRWIKMNGYHPAASCLVHDTEAQPLEKAPKLATRETRSYADTHARGQSSLKHSISIMMLCSVAPNGKKIPPVWLQANLCHLQRSFGDESTSMGQEDH